MLPIRLTDTIDRKRKLFRGRRGFIIGWSPHENEERTDVDGEWLLSVMPPVIYCYFPGATWEIDKELGVGVYPLSPVSRSWEVNKKTKTKVRRTGYLLVPDFASTAHMIQGQSLEACFADLVHNDIMENETAELHISGYVMLSRAKFLKQIWILQAFAQRLFTQGPPSNPDLLLRKLCRKISIEDAKKEMMAAELMERRSK